MTLMSLGLYNEPSGAWYLRRRFYSDPAKSCPRFDGPERQPWEAVCGFYFL